MERCWTFLLTSVRAENCRAILTTEVAYKVFEFVVREEEVVELPGGITLFLAFLHLLRPHRTVNVHKLVYLEWNQTACD